MKSMILYLNVKEVRRTFSEVATPHAKLSLKKHIRFRIVNGDPLDALDHAAPRPNEIVLNTVALSDL